MLAARNLNIAHRVWTAGICLVLATGSQASAQKTTPKFSSWPDIAYAGSTFDGFVRDSFKNVGTGNASQFYASMEMGVESYFEEPWNSFINRQRGLLAIAKTPEAKRDARIAVCTEVHQAIKRLIPKFSLSRGFEFAYLTTKGERQCFLQSVLISSILQRCEIEAGVVMIYRNTKGQPSNLGHCTVLVRLSQREQVLVDASAMNPFIAQQGIFARTREGYVFLRPIFEDKVFITGYQREVLPVGLIPNESVLPVDTGFMRSMFEYYRGERAENGVLSKKPSKDGIKQSIKHFKKSIRLSRSNPLPVYMLGVALEKQGKSDQWKYFFLQSRELYARSGWVPSNVASAIDRVKPDKK